MDYGQIKQNNMNWYKYWYFTIYFIYDKFSKNAEDNKIYSVGMFTLIIYMLYGVLSCLINSVFDSRILKYISHPIFHIIFILVLYMINACLFENEMKVRKARSVYKENIRQSKNVFFILLTIGVIFTFYFCMIHFKNMFIIN